MSTNSLTIGALLAKTIPFLKEQGLENPKLEADLLLAEALGMNRVQLYTKWDRPLDQPELQRYRELILKRVQGSPLAYLTGKKAFLSWEFRVSPAVLIPRPETELLIETVYELVKDQPRLEAVDVGTGSGVIAICLAKLLPQSRWRAGDFSSAALAVAAQNAAELGVAERIDFECGDLLTPWLDAAVSFDLIVANLPYVASRDLATLAREVQQEPGLALDGGSDGLELYRRFLPMAVQLLQTTGIIALEHGTGQRQPLEELGTRLGLSCQSYRDLAGSERILIFRSQGDRHA